jgi:hypothetical protein
VPNLGFTSNKRRKCMIDNGFSLYPRFLWITMWGSCAKLRQVLDSSGLATALPVLAAGRRNHKNQ